MVAGTYHSRVMDNDIIGEDALPPKPDAPEAAPAAHQPVPEIDGRPGLEPTRYGDWEKDGRCIDF